MPVGLLCRGRRFYYRLTVPTDAQSLLKRIEIWRSLRTDILAVALKRLPSVAADLIVEIEQARAKAGLAVDETLIRPSSDNPSNHSFGLTASALAVAGSATPVVLEEAYRRYIDDPTRAWSNSTREAYETIRKLTIAILGADIPVANLSRAHCRDLLDVLFIQLVHSYRN